MLCYIKLNLTDVMLWLTYEYLAPMLKWEGDYRKPVVRCDNWNLVYRESSISVGKYEG